MLVNNCLKMFYISSCSILKFSSSTKLYLLVELYALMLLNIKLNFGYFLEVRPSFLLYSFYTCIIVYISTKRKTIGCTQQKRETIPICAQSDTTASNSTRTSKCQPAHRENGMCYNTERVS